MIFLKFNNEDFFHQIEDENIAVDIKVIIKDTPDIKENSSGFKLYDIDYNMIQDLSAYNHISYNKDGTIIFEIKETLKHVYYIADENNFIINAKFSTDIINEINYFYIRDTYDNDFDIFEIYYGMNFIPKYKVINNNIVKTTEEDFELWQLIKLEEAKKDKLNEISTLCKEAILNGIEHNGEYFSYTTDDQNNILNLVQLSKATGLSVPYHANGLGCRLYSPEDINAIYVKQEINVTHHTTYHNQLKLYINSLQTKEEVNRVYYGMELSGEYLDTYNEIMQNANLIVSAFTAN